VKTTDGVPYLTILDSDGKVLTNQETGALEDGDHHDPAKVKAFLEKWKVHAKDANQVLQSGVARAKADKKLVFLHFGAPWCGWCHRLEDLLAKQSVSSILDKDFVFVKIDIDRMQNGKEVEKRFRNDKGGGIPWIAFLDGEGQALATSDAPDGNIGCPWEPKEIDWFMGMLKQVRKNVSPDELETLDETWRGFIPPKKAESRPQ
jgi:thiol-disulfide isomerase/thioredoxin